MLVMVMMPMRMVDGEGDTGAVDLLSLFSNISCDGVLDTRLISLLGNVILLLLAVSLLEPDLPRRPNNAISSK